MKCVAYNFLDTYIYSFELRIEQEKNISQKIQTKPDADKCRGNDNNALDSILSGPHQRITRYGLLLDPLCKRVKENTVRLKLTDIKSKADSLCRWINGRVSLDHLYKGQLVQ